MNQRKVRLRPTVAALLFCALGTSLASTWPQIASAAETVSINPTEHYEIMSVPGAGFQDFVAQVPSAQQLAECSYDTTVDQAGLSGGSLYVRLLWRDLEPEEGQYAWPLMDQLFECAEQRNQTIDFRLMVSWPGAGEKNCWSDPSENDNLDHGIPCCWAHPFSKLPTGSTTLSLTGIVQYGAKLLPKLHAIEPLFDTTSAAVDYLIGKSEDLSFNAFVEDLEAVADKLALERFPLLGISQGCAVAIEYAVRHPERVSGLVLIGGYASGWRHHASQQEQALRETMMKLTELGWGTDNPAYRQVFSQTFMPDATNEELDWFNEFQRLTASPHNAARFQDAFGHIDVRDRLHDVKAPTIVLHSKYDQRIPIELGHALARGIPDAQFVPLESRNHVLVDHEPAWNVYFEAVGRFMKEKGI